MPPEFMQSKVNMPDIAIILGSGQELLNSVDVSGEKPTITAYGETSSPLIRTTLGKQEVVLLARHAIDHSIPPHKINYRANIAALQSMGIKKIIALAAVGGITSHMSPGRLILPDQLIDYTWGREHTFFDGDLNSLGSRVDHVDITHPYASQLRSLFLEASIEANIAIIDGGVYGAVQGPRLETTQEIRRMAQDGCDLVGMTGMPEAALAREAGIEYLCCALVANWAAGVEDGIIGMQEIRETLSKSMQQVHTLLMEVFNQ
ncbi:5'-methylthioadenosine phosphorylase [hydrothermal vent metagenome]|uniref:5'-methylthioadenosine phosphorylase n=1 Tax=hydrothermal vent metagenome TaxID=652676 RepID=A0A3B0YN88_9ZZZZ